eukprot:5250722-Amphidinium_carterae.1
MLSLVSSVRCFHIAMQYLRPWRPTFVELCLADEDSLCELRRLERSEVEKRAVVYITLRLVETISKTPSIKSHMELMHTLTSNRDYRVRVGKLSRRERPWTSGHGYDVRVALEVTGNIVWRPKDGQRECRGFAEVVDAVLREEAPPAEASPPHEPDDEEEEEYHEFADVAAQEAFIVDGLDVLGVAVGGQPRARSNSSSSTSSSSSSSAVEKDGCVPTAVVTSRPIAGASTEPLSGASVAHADVAGATGVQRQIDDMSGPWGPHFYFTYRRPGKTNKKGAWQAFCRYHS